MIDQSAVELEVLSSGSEDITGLYEIIWYLNGRFPGTSVGDKYSSADSAIRALLDHGYIELYRFRPFADGGPIDRIDDVEARALLDDPTTWYPERTAEQGVQVAFMCTDSGEQEYARRYRPA